VPEGQELLCPSLPRFVKLTVNYALIVHTATPILDGETQKVTYYNVISLSLFGTIWTVPTVPLPLSDCYKSVVGVVSGNTSDGDFY